MIENISFVHWLVLLSVLVSFSGSVPYIRDTLAGRTKPNRVTWFMWAVAPLLGAVAAVSAHADGWSTVRTFVAGLVPLLIFIASFVNPKSYWQLTTFDFACGVSAVLGLVLWQVAESPRLAILFLAIADIFACIPTIMKAWTYPETETGITYFAGLVSVLLVIPAIPVWNIENSAFPLYLLVANFFLFATSYRIRIKRYFGCKVESSL